MKEADKRNRAFDILRGIAVTFVVLGHSRFPLSGVLYQFHVALFFIVSGYFWKESYSESIDGIICLIRNKVRTLWLPYVIWNGIFMLCNNLLCASGLYLCSQEEIVQAGAGEIHRMLSAKDMVVEALKIVIFMGGTELGGASWFFRVLFVVTIAFGLIEFILRKWSIKYIIAECILGGIFSIAGRVCRNTGSVFDGKVAYLFETIGVCLMAYALLACGRFFSCYIKKINSSRMSVSKFVIGLVGTVILYKCGLSFFRVIYGISISVFGWLLISGVSALIDKHANIMAKSLAYLGRNTVPVFMGHFACFKIVNIVVRKVNGLPKCFDGAFPVIGGHWFIYTVTGIALPLILNFIYGNLKRITK